MRRHQTFTFAIIGHNEERTLSRALGQAQRAASAGDEVWYVDSASTDSSRTRALEAGAVLVEAPIGKGRAIASALTACQTDWLCVLDADIYSASMNIPRALRDAASDHGTAALVIGDFDSGPDSVLSNTEGIYRPLIRALFPEADGRFGSKPLTGFRAWHTSIDFGALPPDFGVEAHINVMSALTGAAILVTSIGEYEGRFGYKPTMGLQIAKPILDLAVETGRLAPARRLSWERWVSDVVKHVATYHGTTETRAAFLADLHRLARRRLPPCR